MIEEIVHVSANLRQDGGGAALLGRSSGRALRRFCARRGLGYRGLHLPADDGSVALDGFRSFGGGRARFSLALWAVLARARGRAALFFDHSGPARALSTPLPRGREPRYAVQLHGIEVWRPLEASRRRSLSRATRCISNSQFTLAAAGPNLPPECRCAVVEPGLLELPAGGELDGALLRRAGSGFVLTVGRMVSSEAYKGHDLLLRAVGSSDSDLRLVLVGDGDDRARLESMAHTLGIAGRTLFCGAVSGTTLAELYRLASVFAMPSRGEGFGLVFLEAMAAGLPCIALEGTAPQEILVDGETGRLVTDDPESIAIALREIVRDRPLARRWGEAGRLRYEARFTFEAFERRLEPVLSELVAA